MRLEVKFLDGSVEWFNVDDDFGDAPYVIKNINGALMLSFSDDNNGLVAIPLASVRVVSIS
jgi:hypothetical protein